MAVRQDGRDIGLARVIDGQTHREISPARPISRQNRREIRLARRGLRQELQGLDRGVGPLTMFGGLDIAG